MSLFRDTALSGLGAVVATGSRFVVTIMLVRLLTPSAYGEFIFAQWVVDLLFMTCSLGLPGAMTRYLPALSTTRDWRSLQVSRWMFAAAGGSFIFVLALFAAYLFLTHRSLSETCSLLLFATGYLMASYLSPVLQGLFRFGAVIAGNVAFALSAPLLILASSRTPSVSGAAMALGGAWLLSSATSIVVATMRKVTASVVVEMQALKLSTVVAYAGNVWIIGLIASLVWSRGELGVLKVNVDSAHIAVYAAALSVIGLVSQGAGLLTGALTPHLVRKWQANDTVGIDVALRMITQAALLVTVSTALLLVSTGDQLIPLLLGPNYNQSFAILSVLSISTIGISSGCANTLLQIQTNGKFGLVVNIIALVVLITISLVLTPFLGVLGAAYARVAAQTVVALITFRQLSKVPGMQRTARDLGLAFVIGVVGLAAFHTFYAFGAPSLVLSILVAGALGACLAAAIRMIIGVPFLSFVRLAR